MQRDAEHVRILSICYYVFAGLQAIGLLIGVIYAGVAVFLGALAVAAPDVPEDDRMAMAILAGFFFLLGAALTILNLIFALLFWRTGRCLARHESLTFCLIMAGLACLLGGIPGMVLGIFTFVILCRDTTRCLFVAEPGCSPFAPSHPLNMQGWSRATGPAPPSCCPTCGAARPSPISATVVPSPQPPSSEASDLADSTDEPEKAPGVDESAD